MTTDLEIIGLPDTLPADAKGYTKHMVMHMSFEDGGAANYTIHAPDGCQLPITYQHDTRKKGANPTGFFLGDVERSFKSWADVAEFWPGWLAARRAEGGAA